jgi:NADPH2:quinone reductase
MKAIGFDRYLPKENPSSFLDLNLPNPVAKGRDLLVQVKAISVNPVDTKVRSRTEGILDEPRIIGWDVAGIV